MFFLYNHRMNYIRKLINTYKFELLVFAVIFFFIFIVYLHCYNFDFTYFDDNILILNKVQEMEKVSYIKDIFSNSVFDTIRDKYYRPVLVSTFWADTLICGGEPGFYHYSNILWHTLATFLLLICLQNMGYSKKVSAAASIIFAIHPALTAAVAWIPGRNDSLLAVFSLLSFIFFIQSTKNNKLSNNILSGFFLLAALLTKETAVVLPALYVLYLFLYGVKTERKTAVKLAGCLLSAIFIYACVRHTVLSSGIKSITSFEMLINLFKSLKATFWYSGIALLTEKTLIYPQLSALPITKSVIAFTLISVLCVHLRKLINFRHILFGITWFAVFLFPTYVLPENIFLPHRLYIPMFGFFIVIFEILKALTEKYPKTKNILPIILGILVISMSFLSYKQTLYYKDKEAFWFKALEEDPTSARVNAIISSYYLEARDFNKAEEHAFTSLKYAQGINFTKALGQIASVYYKKGEWDKSAEYFNRIIETDKMRESGYLGLSYIYEEQGNKQAMLDILYIGVEAIPESKSIKKRINNLLENKKDISYVVHLNI